MVPPDAELMQSLSSVWSSGLYSDLTVLSGDETFKEATSGEIHLEDDRPSIIKKMFDYLYTLDYDDGSAPCPMNGAADHLPSEALEVRDEMDGPVPESPVSENPRDKEDKEKNALISSPADQADKGAEEEAPSLLNAQIYAIGEKYGIHGLKGLALKKFERAIENSWQNNTFCSVIILIYNSTHQGDRGLRDAVTKVACQNAGILKTKTEFQAVLDTLTPFTADLLRETWKKLEEKQEKLAASNGNESSDDRSGLRVYLYDCPACHRKDSFAINEHFANMTQIPITSVPDAGRPFAQPEKFEHISPTIETESYLYLADVRTILSFSPSGIGGFRYNAK
ncbi:hypothetical protein VTN00DRAFT_3040 [Thermoascus crustaceus]|uniref:uncharacterized protein n=1 Tax=Thermoascus crustaceus TaxID=5088 RepID=UPI0037424E48